MSLQIVVANEPRLYREVLAGALMVQRPSYEVVLVEPDELKATLTQTSADLVIAPASSPLLRAYDGVCLLLNTPEGQRVVLLRAGAVAHIIEQADFSDLLSLIDQSLPPDQRDTAEPSDQKSFSLVDGGSPG